MLSLLATLAYEQRLDATERPVEPGADALHPAGSESSVGQPGSGWAAPAQAKPPSGQAGSQKRAKIGLSREEAAMASLSALPTVGPPKPPPVKKKRARRLGYSCTECKLHKVACSRVKTGSNAPCFRCAKLRLQCIPGKPLRVGKRRTMWKNVDLVLSEEVRNRIEQEFLACQGDARVPTFCGIPLDYSEYYYMITKHCGGMDKMDDKWCHAFRQTRTHRLLKGKKITDLTHRLKKLKAVFTLMEQRENMGLWSADGIAIAEKVDPPPDVVVPVARPAAVEQPEALSKPTPVARSRSEPVRKRAKTSGARKPAAGRSLSASTSAKYSAAAAAGHGQSAETPVLNRARSAAQAVGLTPRGRSLLTATYQSASSRLHTREPGGIPAAAPPAAAHTKEPAYGMASTAHGSWSSARARSSWPYYYQQSPYARVAWPRPAASSSPMAWRAMYPMSPSVLQSQYRALPRREWGIRQGTSLQSAASAIYAGQRSTAALLSRSATKPIQGTSMQGTSMQGTSMQGTSMQGNPMQGILPAQYARQSMPAAASSNPVGPITSAKQQQHAPGAPSH